MLRIHSRFEDGALCEWHECRGCKPRFQVGERDAAVTWLRGFLVDDSQVAALRVAAHQAGFAQDFAGLATQQVIDHLAWLISSGRLRVCGEGASVQASATQEILRGEAPKSGFSPLLPERTPSRARPSPPSSPDEATLAGVDAPTMADSLLAAAADGSPFCEVCEAAARPAPTAA